MRSTVLASRRRRALLQALACGVLTGPVAAYAQTPELLTVLGSAPSGDRLSKVFAAGPPAAVLLYCLAPHKMLGWPFNLTKAARQLLAPQYRSLPFLGRLAGRGSTVPLETLLGLAPDLILDVGSVNTTQQSAANRVVQQTGIPYALLDGALAHTVDQLHVMGRLLGVQQRAQHLAQYAEQVLQSSGRGAVPRLGTSKPSVYLARSADGLETGLGHAIHTETIALAGARNVAVAENTTGLGRVSMEQLLHWDPDIILTQELPFYRMASVSPLWRSLRAVREGRLYCAPVLPFGWIDGPPGINRLLGVQWLQAVLADQLRSTTMLNTVSDFFSLFYGQTLEHDIMAAMITNE